MNIKKLLTRNTDATDCIANEETDIPTKKTMKTYRFDYTVEVMGRAHSSVKTIKAYSWLDAAQRLAIHATKRWAQRPVVEVNNAEVEGQLINPDILPDINGAVIAQVGRGVYNI